MRKDTTTVGSVPWIFQLSFVASFMGHSVCSARTCGGATGRVPSDSSYVTVFEDNFDVNGPVCDENWHHQTQFPIPGTWFNNEQQHYTNRTDNSYVQDGSLYIVAKRENYTDQGVQKSFTSARLNSKFYFTYGRVDVMARWTGGTGTWPAIWIMGRNVNETGAYWADQFGEVSWPFCGEVDIVEHFGKDDGVMVAAVHSPSNFGKDAQSGTVTNPDYDSFHLYTMIWEETQMLFFVDGQLYFTYNPQVRNSDTWPFYEPQFLLMNFAVGGLPAGMIGDEFLEGTLEVDYIRVSQRQTVPPEGANAPTTADFLVISLFSEAYANRFVDTWGANWSSAVLEVDNDIYKKYTSLDWVGVEMLSEPVDASEMDFFSFEMWTSDAEEFRVKLVDIGPDGQANTTDDTYHEVTFQTERDRWFVYDLPLANFTDLDSLERIGQLVLSTPDDTQVTVYIDNVFFYRYPTIPLDPAPTPGAAAPAVISLFSGAYDDINGTNWRTEWSRADYAEVAIVGNAVKKYSNLDVVGIEMSPVDATGMEFLSFHLWTPDAPVLRVKLVDFGEDSFSGGGDDAEHELIFQDLAPREWIEFNIPLSDFTGLTSVEHLGQVIFSGDPNNAQNVTIFIDNLYLSTRTPLMAAPTQPPRDPSDVISMFSDVYNDLTGINWRTDWSISDYEELSILGDTVIKYSNLNFVGIETPWFDSNPIDATAMNVLHFDFWSPDIPKLRVRLVDYGGDGRPRGGDDTDHEITYDNPPLGEWVAYDIPLGQFGGLGSRENLVQLIFGGDPAEVSSVTIFIDNVYFYASSEVRQFMPSTAAPTPTVDPNNVISMFSGPYEDILEINWRTEWSDADYSEVKIEGDSVKKYFNLDFVGIETSWMMGSNIDASRMTFLHFDFWSPDATMLRLKLVDFGSDGAFQGGDDTEAEIMFPYPAQNEWVPFDIALSNFTSLGLDSVEHLTQLIFGGDLSGTRSTMFFDNIYFYSDAPMGTLAPLAGPPEPSIDQSRVISLFSGPYQDVPVDTWDAQWSNNSFHDEMIIEGDTVKKYQGLTFVGVETVSNVIDATEMDYFRLDLWTADCEVFRVKLVDFGPNQVFQNACGASDDTEHEIVFENVPLQEWFPIDIPLSDFATLASLENLAQYIFSIPEGKCTAFVDNVLFYKNSDARSLTEETSSRADGTSLTQYRLRGGYN